MKISKILFVIIIAFTFTLACNMSINKSITVRDGETLQSGPKTVNGNISIGNDCVIRGSASTVNGGITVGSNCEVRSLKTVNSGIRVGEKTTVDGDIGTVNGSITCKENVNVNGEIGTVNGSINLYGGVVVDGDAGNINGDIELNNAVVKDDLKTHTGNITLDNKSTVHGDIIIGRSTRTRRNVLEIRITGDSLLKGDVIVKDDDLKVKVYLSKGGKIEGKVRNADLIEE
jgi:DUF4097 and DUF4098 domain-containing protein YvlB